MHPFTRVSMRLRRGELPPEPERDAATEQAAAENPPAEHSERRALFPYRATAAGLIVALAAAGYAATLASERGPASSAYASAVICAVLLGLCYYLGRTRRDTQRLNTAGKILSVIPIVGLICIPKMGGLYPRTKRRLWLRNVAIIMGTAVVELSFDEIGSQFRSVSGAVSGVVGLAAAVWAVVLYRRMPSATNAVPAEPSEVPVEQADRATKPERVPPSPPARADLPDADQTVDVAPLSAAARRLYWLCGSLKFGAIFLALGLLAPNNSLQLRWGSGIVAAAAVVAVFTSALLIQEDRIRPARGVALAVCLTAVICFGAAGFGAVTGSEAGTGVLGFVIWPALFGWLYRRQRSASGLTDAEIQAASRVGHLPRHALRGGSRSFPSVVVWLRAAAGVLLAIPVVLLGLVNLLLNAPVIGDWIQWPLDKLFGFARRSADLLLVGFRGGGQTRVVLASAAGQPSWTLLARGDLAHWGKLGPQRVSFDELLEARLDAYGEVLTLAEASRLCGPERQGPGPSAVVMPVGGPLDDEMLTNVAEFARVLPLLLVVQPIAAARPLINWPALAAALRSHGITVPALADPARTIAILHTVSGENVVYLAEKRQQWGYLAAIHLALGEGLTPEAADDHG
jgi:FtsH-binding integral membrane protein